SEGGLRLRIHRGGSLEGKLDRGANDMPDIAGSAWKSKTLLENRADRLKNLEFYWRALPFGLAQNHPGWPGTPN
ncbi:MAG: hypothetical protein KGJ30_11810, partial [Burkholderiales bacterium]|nr:hypothetical protein [Burkholderiales bacterium]